jgi:hypothetical protein
MRSANEGQPVSRNPPGLNSRAKQASTKPSVRLPISPCENGHSVSTSIRPTSDSDSLGSTSARAEPVRRKRPGLRFASTLRLMARNNSGTRCTSSRITRSGNPLTKPSGSLCAAASVAASSDVK